jgi:phosphatidylglycerol:prolipoprotein diacylglycerol transferase
MQTAVHGHESPSPTRGKPRLARVGSRAADSERLEFVNLRVRGLELLEPHAVGLTYWFDAAPAGDPYTVGVKFTGRREDLTGPLGPEDEFEVVASVHHVLPGSGRTAITHRVAGRAPGHWTVKAEGLEIRSHDASPAVTPLPAAVATGSSTFSPVASLLAPGVVLGAWPGLVLAGFLSALLLQARLAGAHRLASGTILGLALVAGLVGLVGAKVYYRLTHRTEGSPLLLTGMSVQGFVIGAVAVFVGGGTALGVPSGHLLDVTVPALLLGQAVGRLGCFFAGCCVGRPTSSRWGLWSSDRRLGTPRIPVQLMESFAAAVLALGTGLTAFLWPPVVDGSLFVAGFSAYVLVRQLLFPLRDERRATAYGRTVTAVVSAIVLIAALGVILVG